MDLQHAMELLTPDEQGRFDALYARSGETDKLAYFKQVIPVPELTLLALRAANYDAGLFLEGDVFLRDLFGAKQ